MHTLNLDAVITIKIALEEYRNNIPVSSVTYRQHIAELIDTLNSVHELWSEDDRYQNDSQPVYLALPCTGYVDEDCNVIPSTMVVSIPSVPNDSRNLHSAASLPPILLEDSSTATLCEDNSSSTQDATVAKVGDRPIDFKVRTLEELMNYYNLQLWEFDKSPNMAALQIADAIESEVKNDLYSE